MGNSVVSHVNGGIRKRLNYKLIIPRQYGTKTTSSAAGPSSQPIKSLHKFILALWIVSLEVSTWHMILTEIFPFLFSICKEPLITQSNYTLITWSVHNFIFRLIIHLSKVVIKHVLSDNGLSFLNFHVVSNSHYHCSFIKAFHVNFILCLGQKVLVVLRLDLQIITDLDSRKVAETWDFYNGNGFIRHYPFIFYWKFLSKSLLLFKISEGGPVIRGIRGDAGYYACTFGHGDSEHGKSIDLFIRSKRCFEGNTNEFLSSDLGQHGVGTNFLCHILEGHVSSGSFTADEVFIVFHFENTILTCGQDKAVSLTIHRFWSESSTYHIDIFTIKSIFERLRHFQKFKFNDSVLLWAHTLSLGPIMISTRLFISFWKYCVSFSKLDFILRFKLMKLPSYKWIIKWIHISCDERPPPISQQSKINQIFLSFRWEVHEPIKRILEFRYFRLSDSQLLKYFILSRRNTHTLTLLLFLTFIFSFLFRTGTPLFFRFMFTDTISLCFTTSYFSLKSICCCLYWHSSTMKTKWKKYILAYLSLISYLELALRKWEGVTYRY